MRFSVLVMALIALAGCRATATPTLAFDPQAASFIQKQGEGTIEGHAFYRSEKGKVIYAAGEYVWLIPVTPYSDQRFTLLYGNAKYIRARSLPKMDMDESYKTYTRSTKSESNGRFSFDHVPPGAYYVATQVTWQDPSDIFPQGAAIYERVTLTGKEDDSVKVIVSGK
jgi:hypothetical protein